MASVKVEQICGRCKRDHAISSTANGVTAILALDSKKELHVMEITDLVASWPADEMPALIVVQKVKDGAKMITHTNLCDTGEEGRSCVPRVTELVDGLDALPDRKPRTKKVKSAPEVKA